MVDSILDKVANCPMHHVRIALDPDRFIHGIEADFFSLRDHQGRYQRDDLCADAA